MTEAQQKAIRIVEAQLEAVSFDLDANVRGTTASIERHVELLERRRGLERLLKMMGGTPSEYAPAATR